MSSLDDMFGNGNENGEETQAEEMTAFEVIKNLEKSWMNELFSPGNIYIIFPSFFVKLKLQSSFTKVIKREVVTIFRK